MLRTDRGGEFTSKELGEYFAGNGIKRQLTAAYTPQQNGVVERRNQTVVGMARSLLKAKGVPGEFWGEAVTTAVYLLNRGVTKSVDGKTPFEAWHGRRPSVKHLRVFGCVAHVKNTRPNLKKLEDRSTQMVLFGYEPGSAAYRVYDPAARRVQVSRDVVFDEDSSWDWSGALPTDGRRGELESFAVEYFCDQSSTSWNATRPEHALDTGVNGGARSERAPATPAAHGQASSSSTPATPRTPPPP
jgi:hypothetical protein